MVEKVAPAGDLITQMVPCGHLVAQFYRYIDEATDLFVPDDPY